MPVAQTLNRTRRRLAATALAASAAASSFLVSSFHNPLVFLLFFSGALSAWTSWWADGVIVYCIFDIRYPIFDFIRLSIFNIRYSIFDSFEHWLVPYPYDVRLLLATGTAPSSKCCYSLSLLTHNAHTLFLSRSFNCLLFVEHLSKLPVPLFRARVRMVAIAELRIGISGFSVIGMYSFVRVSE